MNKQPESPAYISPRPLPSERASKDIPWKDQNWSQRFTTVLAFLIVAGMFLGLVFLIAGRIGCVIVASLAPFIWLANLPTGHPLKTGLHVTGRILGVILKWCIYIGFTTWACTRYGWVGIFAVPVAKGFVDFSKAVSNWTDHWSKEPRDRR